MKRRPLHLPLLVAMLLLIGIALFATACDSAAESGAIVFDGLVDYPMTFTTLDMDYMDWVTVTAQHPVSGPSEYEGVRLSEVFSYVGVQPEATTLVITAAGGSSVELPLASIAGETAMIALGRGGTLSAVMPGLGPEAWVDDVVGMELR